MLTRLTQKSWYRSWITLWELVDFPSSSVEGGGEEGGGGVRGGRFGTPKTGARPGDYQC